MGERSFSRTAAGTMADWDQVVPPLIEAGLRVVTADLRGHGGGPRVCMRRDP
jgi:hypothetical protein